MANTHQRIDKVPAYLGLNGLLAFTFGTLANPGSLLFTVPAFVAVAIFRPQWVPKIKDQFVKFIKDVGSHVSEDVTRSVNWVKRKFGSKAKAKTTMTAAKTTVVEKASEFKATVQKKTFNNAAKPEASATTVVKKKPVAKKTPKAQGPK